MQRNGEASALRKNADVRKIHEAKESRALRASLTKRMRVGKLYEELINHVTIHWQGSVLYVVTGGDSDFHWWWPCSCSCCWHLLSLYFFFSGTACCVPHDVVRYGICWFFFVFLVGDGVALFIHSFISFFSLVITFSVSSPLGILSFNFFYALFLFIHKYYVPFLSIAVLHRVVFSIGVLEHIPQMYRLNLCGSYHLWFDKLFFQFFSLVLLLKASSPANIFVSLLRYDSCRAS